jgi:hypothetical protein
MFSKLNYQSKPRLQSHYITWQWEWRVVQRLLEAYTINKAVLPPSTRCLGNRLKLLRMASRYKHFKILKVTRKNRLQILQKAGMELLEECKPTKALLSSALGAHKCARHTVSTFTCSVPTEMAIAFWRSKNFNVQCFYMDLILYHSKSLHSFYRICRVILNYCRGSIYRAWKPWQ